MDSLVFGGNFLHSYNIGTRKYLKYQLHAAYSFNWVTELKVIDIEKATRVPKKFRFPYFTKYHDLSCLFATLTNSCSSQTVLVRGRQISPRYQGQRGILTSSSGIAGGPMLVPCIGSASHGTRKRSSQTRCKRTGSYG